MHLPQDVVDRLLVAKGLLEKIRFVPTARPDRVSLAKVILSAHDAAELAAAAVARHLNCLPGPQKSYLMDILSEIKKTQNTSVPHRDYFSQLNTVRKAIKHEGVFPDPQQWYRVGELTYEYVSDWCQTYLGLSLDELDESALIRDEKVKEMYGDAMDSFRVEQYKETLEHLAYACEALFRSNQALRNLGVGKARAEDAIKLAAFGVHANDYLALQEFLPSLAYDRDYNLVIKWDQKSFGHPGNWTRDAAEFSLKTFVDVALRIQDADWIPGAIEFDLLYEHQITALEDGVEITQEKPIKALADTLNQGRAPVKTLNKGEFLKGRVEPKSPKNFLLALLGQEPPTYSIITPDKQIHGDFDADKVHITCVPKDNALVRKYFPNLPEMDYEPVM
ncbi:MAG: hypothetical protein ACOZFS_16355 [Thermodesulfobacteriota bacterium]